MLVELRRSEPPLFYCEVEPNHELINTAMELHFVYIALCNDNSYYVGCTNNLDNRMKRHTKGEIEYTKSRLPIKIITYITFSDKYKAYKFEKYLKTGSGRAFMYKRLVDKLK